MSDQPSKVATNGIVAVVIPRPDDPAEASKWADSMIRVQVAMWVDEGAVCAHCQQPYASVDDFLARAPRYGGPGPVFVDNACWIAWSAPLHTPPAFEDR